MEPDTWEKYTLEIVEFLSSDYSKVTQCGGSGDLGRDIICYEDDNSWTNYQCKHYAKSLSVADAIIEIGKVIFYSYLGEYTLPKRYFFVTPKGSSSDLLKFLQQPFKFKQELYNRWEKSCLKKIRKAETLLTVELKNYIEDNVDFTIFKEIPPLESIRIHRKTKYHVLRFGYYGTKRPTSTPAPMEIDKKEIKYTKELLKVFSDYKSKEININNLEDYNSLQEDFHGARNNFYSAESLERFSRDYIHHSTFEDLKSECYESISPTVKQSHNNTYEKYLKTLEVAVQVNYTSHTLHPFINQQDKKGMCHQLVNDNRLKWKNDED